MMPDESCPSCADVVRSCSNLNSASFHCDICNVSFKSRKFLKIHCDGLFHRDKVLLSQKVPTRQNNALVVEKRDENDALLFTSIQNLLSCWQFCDANYSQLLRFNKHLTANPRALSSGCKSLFLQKKLDSRSCTSSVSEKNPDFTSKINDLYHQSAINSCLHAESKNVLNNSLSAGIRRPDVERQSFEQDSALSGDMDLSSLCQVHIAVDVITSSFSCKLCCVETHDAGSLKVHASSLEHCQLFLLRQHELGMDEFKKQFGNVPFCRILSETIPAPPDDLDPNMIRIYHSAVVNNLLCRACEVQYKTLKEWFQHACDSDHSHKLHELLQLHGVFSFLATFGDLALPESMLPISVSKGSNKASEKDLKMLMKRKRNQITGKTNSLLLEGLNVKEYKFESCMTDPNGLHFSQRSLSETADYVELCAERAHNSIQKNCRFWKVAKVFDHKFEMATKALDDSLAEDRKEFGTESVNERSSKVCGRNSLSLAKPQSSNESRSILHGKNKNKKSLCKSVSSLCAIKETVLNNKKRNETVDNSVCQNGQRPLKLTADDKDETLEPAESTLANKTNYDIREISTIPVHISSLAKLPFSVSEAKCRDLKEDEGMLPALKGDLSGKNDTIRNIPVLTSSVRQSQVSKLRGCTFEHILCLTSGENSCSKISLTPQNNCHSVIAESGSSGMSENPRVEIAETVLVKDHPMVVSVAVHSTDFSMISKSSSSSNAVTFPLTFSTNAVTDIASKCELTADAIFPEHDTDRAVADKDNLSGSGSVLESSRAEHIPASRLAFSNDANKITVPNSNSMTASADLCSIVSSSAMLLTDCSLQSCPAHTKFSSSSEYQSNSISTLETSVTLTSGLETPVESVGVSKSSVFSTCCLNFLHESKDPFAATSVSVSEFTIPSASSSEFPFASTNFRSTSEKDSFCSPNLNGASKVLCKATVNEGIKISSAETGAVSRAATVAERILAPSADVQVANFVTSVDMKPTSFNSAMSATVCSSVSPAVTESNLVELFSSEFNENKKSTEYSRNSVLFSDFSNFPFDTVTIASCPFFDKVVDTSKPGQCVSSVGLDVFLEGKFSLNTSTVNGANTSALIPVTTTGIVSSSIVPAGRILPKSPEQVCTVSAHTIEPTKTLSSLSLPMKHTVDSQSALTLAKVKPSKRVVSVTEVNSIDSHSLPEGAQSISSNSEQKCLSFVKSCGDKNNSLASALADISKITPTESSNVVSGAVHSIATMAGHSVCSSIVRRALVKATLSSTEVLAKNSSSCSTTPLQGFVKTITTSKCTSASSVAKNAVKAPVIKNPKLARGIILSKPKNTSVLSPQATLSSSSQQQSCENIINKTETTLFQSVISASVTTAISKSKPVYSMASISKPMSSLTSSVTASRRTIKTQADKSVPLRAKFSNARIMVAPVSGPICSVVMTSGKLSVQTSVPSLMSLKTTFVQSAKPEDLVSKTTENISIIPAASAKAVVSQPSKYLSNLVSARATLDISKTTVSQISARKTTLIGQSKLNSDLAKTLSSSSEAGFVNSLRAIDSNSCASKRLLFTKTGTSALVGKTRFLKSSNSTVANNKHSFDLSVMTSAPSFAHQGMSSAVSRCNPSVSVIVSKSETRDKTFQINKVEFRNSFKSTLGEHPACTTADSQVLGYCRQTSLGISSATSKSSVPSRVSIDGAVAMKTPLLDDDFLKNPDKSWSNVKDTQRMQSRFQSRNSFRYYGRSASKAFRSCNLETQNLPDFKLESAYFHQNSNLDYSSRRERTLDFKEPVCRKRSRLSSERGYSPPAKVSKGLWHENKFCKDQFDDYDSRSFTDSRHFIQFIESLKDIALELLVTKPSGTKSENILFVESLSYPDRQRVVLLSRLTGIIDFYLLFQVSHRLARLDVTLLRQYQDLRLSCLDLGRIPGETMLQLLQALSEGFERNLF